MTATGRTPYWWEAIATAKANGGTFTAEDVRKAGGWVECACGKQDPRIPRNEKGEPADDALAYLGADFNFAVVSGHPAMAAEILGQIEKRAGKLVAKLPRAVPCRYCSTPSVSGDCGKCSLTADQASDYARRRVLSL